MKSAFSTGRKEHRKYVYVFGITLSLCLIVMLAASMYIQPLEGELTRLGSYAERDFGWNLLQKKIRGDANLASVYKRNSDVLIVGDSFSTNGIWQPFFQSATNLSYVTLNIRKTSFHDLLNSKSFMDYPPRILIVQCVERELLYFFRNLDFTCNRNQSRNARITVKTSVPSVPPEYYEEKRRTFDIRQLNLKYAASVIVNTLLRNFSGMDSRNTRRFALSRDDLFSNRRSHEIIVFEGDMDKLAWKQEDIAKAACSIQGLQDRVQANGETLFIFMLAPDKSTAYAEYIKGSVFRNRLDTQQLLLNYGINAPRIDIVLKEAIDRGEKDIYIPSGTHWSARGYGLAAEVIVNFIKQQSPVTGKHS